MAIGWARRTSRYGCARCWAGVKATDALPSEPRLIDVARVVQHSQRALAQTRDVPIHDETSSATDLMARVGSSHEAS